VHYLTDRGLGLAGKAYDVAGSIIVNFLRPEAKGLEDYDPGTAVPHALLTGALLLEATLHAERVTRHWRAWRNGDALTDVKEERSQHELPFPYHPYGGPAQKDLWAAQARTQATVHSITGKPRQNSKLVVDLVWSLGQAVLCGTGAYLTYHGLCRDLDSRIAEMQANVD
jgi:hypothetical protein